MERNSIEIIEAQIRECYGRAVWTHKTHEKCADLLTRMHDNIKLWQIILSAITTSGIFIAVFGKNQTIGILSALISLLLTILNAYVKKYDLGGISQKHADAAASLWNIRECYVSLLTDIRSQTMEFGEVKKVRDKLQADLYKLYKGSPRTNHKAYKEASKALKEMDEMTFNDQEIDKLLPKELRKISQ